MKKHLKHPFVKFNNEGEWEGVENRVEQNRKLQEFLEEEGRGAGRTEDIIGKYLQGKQQLTKNLIDFVVESAYPYVS